jgi:hypothetical protein
MHNREIESNESVDDYLTTILGTDYQLIDFEDEKDVCDLRPRSELFCKEIQHLFNEANEAKSVAISQNLLPESFEHGKEEEINGEGVNDHDRKPEETQAANDIHENDSNEMDNCIDECECGNYDTTGNSGIVDTMKEVTVVISIFSMFSYFALRYFDASTL